jgi:NAD(P)-dependent dehydrogenase (short-subunit alcohol dehydrogenase family)
MPAALVTGGSSGIGLAIARALRDDGYDLTLVARRAAPLEAATAALDALAVAADVSNEDDCGRAVAEHADRFGSLDVLVNSAGVGVGGRIEDLSAKHWDLQLSVNLRGAFLMTRFALPLLKRSRGLVVNLASIAGTMPAPGLSAYGAAKAGLIAFTKTLNAEHAADGIRATAICPGFVDTPMATWTGMGADELIRPEDCAEVVRALTRLGPRARIPQIVIERLDGPASR